MIFALVLVLIVVYGYIIFNSLEDKGNKIKEAEEDDRK